MCVCCIELKADIEAEYLALISSQIDTNAIANSAIYFTRLARCDDMYANARIAMRDLLWQALKLRSMGHAIAESISNSLWQGSDVHIVVPNSAKW